MKNVIAISACLKYCSVAISYENTLFEVNENVDATAYLVYLTDVLIKQHHINLQKIKGIITITGPGSFTGIRVAQSFAKGLALSLGLPAISINCFDVIRSIHEQEDCSNVVIVIKSEKDQIYYKIGDEIGITTTKTLADKIASGTVLMGDAIAEVVTHAKDKIIATIQISDFREAKRLLKFSHLITAKSTISPFYISTASTSKQFL
ncbi:MAG: tRNA (adenosine(37)-N6)-threonylcarbamoyltransferase complex dimerization subunit type 1 TsaB [Holosporaceae bacterium]|jgi:tRNA threonylcarbamoyl adenosine modification protein YeaZ|nr:tRNA (adenosine(37)-N6)-threonylcarbamoyltransferase complex dimerization subunit type 1 TsaB [Holosporaceae bacterium]